MDVAYNDMLVCFLHGHDNAPSYASYEIKRHKCISCLFRKTD